MDRFVTKDEIGFGFNCSICSRFGHCSCLSRTCEEDCIQELFERLYNYESEAEELELKIEKLKFNPVFGKFFK